jgi:hypothetical protein
MKMKDEGSDQVGILERLVGVAVVAGVAFAIWHAGWVGALFKLAKSPGPEEAHPVSYERPGPDREPRDPTWTGDAPFEWPPKSSPDSVHEMDALHVPYLEWPPPEASATLVLPQRFFVGATFLSHIATRLEDALQAGGYEYRFLGAPNGFALISRIERIREDGAPDASPGRWDLDRKIEWSLPALLRGLFSAPEGYFRVIVLVVTNEEFGQSGHRASSEEALKWLRFGLNALPPAIGALPVESRVRCTALVYEFSSQGFDGVAVVKRPGRFEARHHLEKAGLWSVWEGSKH